MAGVRSIDPETGGWGRHIYYIGIIDILIHYNTRKAAETQLKGAMGQACSHADVDPASIPSQICTSPAATTTALQVLTE